MDDDDDDDTRDPDWQPKFDDEDESYIPPVPALPSLDETQLNPNQFLFFLRIQVTLVTMYYYIYFGHLTNNIFISFFKHAEELQHQRKRRNVKLPTPEPSIFITPPKGRLLKSPPAKTFVDVITTSPRTFDTKPKKIGVVEVTHSPDAEVPEKDATDQLIVSILPHTCTCTCTHTHT